MYDPRTQVGRYGFELQLQLLADPNALSFDHGAKLGNRFQPSVLQGLGLPQGWRITADACGSSHYFDTKDAVPEEHRRWFMSDHHQRFADHPGYRATPTLYRSPHVGFQVELVSAPFDDGYSRASYLADLRTLYRAGLVPLVDAGHICALHPEKQQNVLEQVSVELTDTTYPWSSDPLERLTWLGLGFHVLSRCRDRLQPRDEHGWVLDMLTRDLLDNRRRLSHYDVLCNYGLLLDGYLWPTVDGFDLSTLQRFVDSRAHAAVFATAFDHYYCHFYVHGRVTLSGEDLSALTREDFGLMRALGIDPVFLGMFAGLDETHIDATHRTLNLPQLRETMGSHIDLHTTGRVLREALDGHTTTSLTLPTCHPRKTITEGAVYIEFRHLHGLRANKHPRYPSKFLPLDTEQGRIQVIYPEHMHDLAHDLSSVLDMALIIGRQVHGAIDTGSHGIRERDGKRFLEYFGQVADIVLQAYQRPPWNRPDPS